MSGKETIEVEVVFALPDRVWRRRIEVEPGTTAGRALAMSGLAERVGDQPVQLGIFGRKVGRDHVMQRGERLELYRPLSVDPKQRRRRRASEKRTR